MSILDAGILGASMDRNPAHAGHTVRAWNRSRAKAEQLTAEGAYIAGTPAEAVEGADVVLTMLHDGPAALDVRRQAALALRSSTAWVQSTTAGAEAIADLATFAAECGPMSNDVPVLGTRRPAEAGQLLVLAAGPAEKRQRVTPVLDAVGARTVWTGEDGAEGTAIRLKLVANSWVIATASARGEALALAKALGVKTGGPRT